MNRAVLFLVLCTFLAGHLSAGSESGITLETLSELRAERGHIHSGYSFHGFDANGQPIASPRDDMDIPVAIGNLIKIYGVPICSEFEYDTTQQATMPGLNIRTGQRLVDALDDLTRNSNGLAQWRLLNGSIVVQVRPNVEENVEEAHQPVLDRVIFVDIQAVSPEEALIAFEEAYNRTEPSPPRMPLVASALCRELPEEFQARVEAAGGPFVLRGEMTARDALLSIVSFTGAGGTRYSTVHNSGRQSLARHAGVKLYSVPCDDSFHSVDDMDRFMERLDARGERLGAYQQAIDEARAAAEREQLEAAE